MGPSFEGLSFEGLQQPMESPVATDVGPSLAACNGLLFAAWKGSSGDERIWYSFYDGAAPDNGVILWTQQQSMPDPIRTSFRPSLVAMDQGDTPQRLYAAWKGSSGDERIWYSFMDGASPWAPQRQIIDANGVQVASSVGPSLAVFNNQLWAAWKGSSGDEKIWYSSFDGTSWAQQEQMPNPVASSVGPSLAVCNNQLYAAWKGSGSDERIWYLIAPDNKGFFGGQDQEPLPSPIASSVGPSLAWFDERLYIAWKGSGGDDKIWWTSATTP